CPGQYGRCRQIVIPQVVMHDLIMPAALAGRRVECDHAVGEQVLPQPLPSVEIERRRSGAREHEPAPLIDAETTPYIGAASGLRRITFPGVVTELSRLRERVEDPLPFPGADVEGANMTRCRRPGALSILRAEDDQIFVDGAGRRRRAEVR